MIVKAFVATALVAAPLVASDDVAYVQYPQVAQVVCNEGKGSAVRTTEGWLSVNHVTSLTNCRINGWPAPVITARPDLDFSQIVTLAKARGVKINCDGFKAGQYYWASGFAEGLPYQTNIRVQALGLKGWHGFDVLAGDHYFIPGMSGGAVWTADGGELVGMVNAYNPVLSLSFSRALKDTSLCR